MRSPRWTSRGSGLKTVLTRVESPSTRAVVITNCWPARKTTGAPPASGQDTITVRGNLPAAYKAKIKATLLAFDFSTLPQDVQDMFKSDVAMADYFIMARM